MIVHDAHIVRDEGSVVVFEGIAEFSTGADVVWFGVDRREAVGAAQAAEDGIALFVEPWQVLGRTEQVTRPPAPTAEPWEHPALGEPDGPKWLDRI